MGLKEIINTSCYRKNPKNSDTRKNCCNHPKIWTTWLYHRIMRPKGGDGMANSVDPDQTTPLGAVWSVSTLFAQTCLSENLGSLWYFYCKCRKSLLGEAKPVSENIWATSWENLFLLYANNKGADQPAHSRSLISTFVVRCLDSIIYLVSIWAISWL